MYTMLLYVCLINVWNAHLYVGEYLSQINIVKYRVLWKINCKQYTNFVTIQELQPFELVSASMINILSS